MAKLNMVQAINLALHEEMKRDPAVLVMGEDVGVDGGVFRVTEDLLEKFGSDRVIDTPLAESGIVGTAIGMAVSGLKPVAEIQFEGFSYMTIPACCTCFQDKIPLPWQVPLPDGDTGTLWGRREGP